MKTPKKMPETIVGAARELLFGHPDIPALPARDKRSLIQWKTELQIQEVSKMLAGINQVAIRLEADGDYSKSGDLAYQIQEIVRTTEELFKKTQRVADAADAVTATPGEVQAFGRE